MANHRKFDHKKWYRCMMQDIQLKRYQKSSEAE